MPKIKLNPTFDEFRGSVNNLTYRKAYGKTFASVKPDRSNVQLSPAQVAHKQRFAAAAAYGKTVMADADVRALYQQAAKERNMPLFALTVADFMNVPSIAEVDLSAYTGQVDGLIKIKATDDFGITSVHVTITNNFDHALIESGDATETAPSSGLWLYNTTTAIPTETIIDIKVVAMDRPGGTAINTQSKSL